MSENTRQPQTWYFTFGVNHALKNHVQRIHAPDRNAARLKMIDVYGQQWCDQYDGTEFANVNEKYGPYQFLPPLDVSNEEADVLASRMGVPR